MRPVLFLALIATFAAFAADGPGSCTASKPFAPAAGDWNGWSPEAGNSRHQPQPGLAAADIPKLKVKWAIGYAGMGDTRNQSQASIVGGRVFTGSFSGKVY